MLTKISHINNFAVFKDYDWDQNMKDSDGKILEFKKLNIIYGRNYSGKTSLSRIVRSLETGIKHEKYLNSSYEFKHSKQPPLGDKNLTNSPYTVRVYNRDFVDENLKWLSNPDGSIKPFTILGEQNIAIEEKITTNKKLLGSTSQKTGLHWESFCKASDYRRLNDELLRKQRELDEKLREKANSDIKQNPLYRNVTYNINSIKFDIAFILNNKPEILSAEWKNELTQRLTEKPKNRIEFQINIDNKLPAYRNAAAELLGREVSPTSIITELRSDPIIEEWVRGGLAHHKHHTNCQFCGGSLTEKAWERLNNHFNKDSENLRSLIDSLINEIHKEQQKAKMLSLPNEASFYSNLQPRYRNIQSKLIQNIEKYTESLEEIITDLNFRKSDIYNKTNISKPQKNFEISAIIEEINSTINDHNNQTNTLSSDQEQIRRSLRLSEVSTFIKDIDYEAKNLQIEQISKELHQLETTIRNLDNRQAEITRKISELSMQLQDESKGAELVNNYLKNHFGHEALQLVATEDPDSRAITFSITRNGEPAYNLSEGECSLVAFCYFIAKLDDINTAGKELILWIDDPISSLDSNHIYFIFSLIESALAKPSKSPAASASEFKYNQLFISTHNLDFLKYLKRIYKPKNNHEYFITERAGQSSTIRPMPNYLKKYITEFNYLFSQIYKCANISTETANHDNFYNFGNNLRKFLEAYLFYKYPNNKPNDEKLLKFFGGSTLNTDIANRINNELSHLEEIFDRSMRPIEIPEIPALAKFVLQTIEQKDPDQYSALLESIKDIA